RDFHVTGVQTSALPILVKVEQDFVSRDKTVAHQYLVKRSHCSFRRARDILQEHAVLQHLACKEIPVAALIRSNQGLTALELGDRSEERRVGRYSYRRCR